MKRNAQLDEVDSESILVFAEEFLLNPTRTVFPDDSEMGVTGLRKRGTATQCFANDLSQDHAQTKLATDVENKISNS